MIEARQRTLAPPRHAFKLLKAQARLNQAALSVGAALLVFFACVDPAAATSQRIDAGAAELRAGRYQSAIQQLTAALGDESLSSRQAATALYYRGLANRKLGRPAQAIADLGNGIFLGLASTDRVTAQVERGFAFRDLGLAEEAQRELAYAQKAAPKQASRLIDQGGSNIREVATGTPEVPTGSWWNPLSRSAAPAPVQARAPAANPAATESWSTSVATGDQPAAPPPSPQAPAAPPAQSTETAAPTPSPPPQSSGNAITRWFGSWGSSYAEPPNQTASTGEGGYRLQLAASRSEAEARQLWQKVSAANPGLSGKTPQIEKADVGDLGTFYRLQIGPFSDKGESEKLCNDLKRSGVECFLVVTR